MACKNDSGRTRKKIRKKGKESKHYAYDTLTDGICTDVFFLAESQSRGETGQSKHGTPNK